MLSPVTLSAHGCSTSELLRTLTHSFKEWLLLSQPPGCLRIRTSFHTQHGFGTLDAGPGCFPLDREPCRTRSHSHGLDAGIRSLIGLGRL